MAPTHRWTTARTQDNRFNFTIHSLGTKTLLGDVNADFSSRTQWIKLRLEYRFLRTSIIKVSL